MGLNSKLIRWITNFLYRRKLIISINSQISDPITPTYGVPQDNPLSPIFSIPYISVIPQPLDALVNLSQLTDDIAIWAQAPGVRSINLKLQKYLNQILTFCDMWRIKLNPKNLTLSTLPEGKLSRKPWLRRMNNQWKLLNQ